MDCTNTRSLPCDTQVNVSFDILRKMEFCIGRMKSALLALLLLAISGATTTQPSITLVSPVNGSTVSGTILLKAECSPDTVKVEFYRDGILIATVDRTKPPSNLRLTPMVLPNYYRRRFIDTFNEASTQTNTRPVLLAQVGR